jgi:hypothetical protein
MYVLRFLSEGGEGPNTELLWLLYAGISFFFLVIVTGWWSASRKPAEPQPRHEEIEYEKHEQKGGRKK